MYWTHRQRQGWLVVGLGAALMGGCATPAAVAPAGRRLTFADVADAPPFEEIGDSMPLLPGENAAPMPIARPGEQAVSMPGAGAPPDWPGRRLKE